MNSHGNSLPQKIKELKVKKQQINERKNQVKNQMNKSNELKTKWGNKLFLNSISERLTSDAEGQVFDG